MMGRNANREKGNAKGDANGARDEEGRKERRAEGEVEEEMGEEQTFYSGISNGGAKSPCNFLSAGRIHPRGPYARGEGNAYISLDVLRVAT